MGPVITTRDYLGTALIREVIYKELDKFKIPCLVTIRKLFWGNDKRFVVGFGNRETVTYTYVAVGIEKKYIYISLTLMIMHWWWY
jgi:phosphatidate phosphatase LPIN